MNTDIQNERPLVTIIVPVYNAEDSIKRCLDSILKQTYTEIEILALNDGSKDQSLGILLDYSQKHSSIKVIDQENCGVSITRNRGIKLAKGTYVCFIDNDDYLDSNYVETFVNHINESNTDIVVGGYRRVNTDFKILFQEKLQEGKWSKYVIMAPWAKIYRTQFLLDNDIQFLDYKIGEDAYFNLDAFSKTEKIAIIDYIGYNWFFNDTSVSNTSQRGLSEEIDILFLLEKIRNLYTDNMNDYIKYFFKRYYIWYLLFSGRHSSKSKFLQEYHRLKNWISINQLHNKINPLSKQLAGEGYKNRIIVLIFSMLEKLHLVPLFATFYCKG